MHDPLFVRRFERLGDLSGHMEGIVGRHRSAGDAIRERGSLDELHHERRRAAAVLDTVDGGDVGMIRERSCLTGKARQAFAVGRKRLGEDLDRDVAPEIGIGRA